jgi:hypothetical protein
MRQPDGLFPAPQTTRVGGRLGVDGATAPLTSATLRSIARSACPIPRLPSDDSSAADEGPPRMASAETPGSGGQGGLHGPPVGSDRGKGLHLLRNHAAEFCDIGGQRGPPGVRGKSAARADHRVRGNHRLGDPLPGRTASNPADISLAHDVKGSVISEKLAASGPLTPQPDRRSPEGKKILGQHQRPFRASGRLWGQLRSRRGARGRPQDE